MNTTWQTHLEREGARFDSNGSASFSDASTEMQAIEGDVIADLSHLGLIRVHGSDARDFLQGQFSNDLRQVDAEHSQLSAYCSPKGRILANFRLLLRDEAFYLVMPRELIEPTLRRLRMFVLRSQVVLEDESDSLTLVGVAGDHAVAALHENFSALPGTVDASHRDGDVTAVCLPGAGAPRYLLLGPADAMVALWNRLKSVAQPVGAAAWRMLDIRAGIPLIQTATVEAFVPQMVNYQLIGGVSFKKGCYPGQEVVARMQYLGKLKRRMYRARIDAGAGLDAPPAAGDDLYDANGDGQSAGKIVDAQPLANGGYELLAVIQISSAEAGALRLRSPEGIAIVLETLPYPLEQAG